MQMRALDVALERRKLHFAMQDILLRDVLPVVFGKVSRLQIVLFFRSTFNTFPTDLFCWSVVSCFPVLSCARPTDHRRRRADRGSRAFERTKGDALRIRDGGRNGHRSALRGLPEMLRRGAGPCTCSGAYVL